MPPLIPPADGYLRYCISDDHVRWIEDDAGVRYSLEQAKALYDAGLVKAGNSQFLVLAHDFRFDHDAMMDHYEVPMGERVFEVKMSSDQVCSYCMGIFGTGACRNSSCPGFGQRVSVAETNEIPFDMGVPYESQLKAWEAEWKRDEPARAWRNLKQAAWEAVLPLVLWTVDALAWLITALCRLMKKWEGK